MKVPSFCVRCLICALALLTLSGCASRVNFVRSVVPPLPNVLAGQNEFKLTFSVINPTSNPVAVDALKVKVRSQYFTKSHSGACNRTDYLTNPLIDANGGKWIVQDYEFSKSSFGIGDPCYCTKSNSCNGNVWVQLLSAQSNSQLPGPRTHLQIYFGGSGTLSDMSVTDQSD